MALQADSPDEAQRAYQEALRLQPAFVEAHVNFGLLNHNAGELKEAETCYRRALQYGPDSALAHFNLAVVLEYAHSTARLTHRYPPISPIDHGATIGMEYLPRHVRRLAGGQKQIAGRHFFRLACSFHGNFGSK